MTIVIVEDEQRAANRLERLIQEIDLSFHVIAHLDSIESLVDYCHSKPLPDLFFMDIQLADGSVFEAFSEIQITVPIIFTTAYDQFAIDAFSVNAIDYLLKPIKKTALAKAIRKFRTLQEKSESLANTSETMFLTKKNKLKRFLIRIHHQLKIIEIADAFYFFTQNKITFLVTGESKRYPIDFSLEKLEEELDNAIFFRVNRQYIVSAKAISKMATASKSRVKLWLKPLPAETIVSTERSGKFKKWLTGDIDLDASHSDG